jgi:hypothetical protein
VIKLPSYWEIHELLSLKRRWLIEPCPRWVRWIIEHEQGLNCDFPAPSSWPSVPPLFRYETVPAGGPTDFPAPSVKWFIVSERLRHFFETEAPGHLSFYPIRIDGPASEDLKPYFAVRFERAWDCLHPHAWDEDEHGRFVAFPMLDRRKIPADDLIGGVKHYGVNWLIRGDLKQKLVREGFTGFDFYAKAAFVDDGSAPMFEHVNHKRPWPGGGSGALEAEKPPEASGTAAGSGPKKSVGQKRKPKGK